MRLGWLFVVMSACGPVELAAPATSRQAIINGTVSTHDTQVFALGSSTGGMYCTATLIGERTLLTAAHCLASGSQVVQASNQTDVKGWPGDAIPVVDQRPHPRYNGLDGDWDVGMMLLAIAPTGVQPKPWNRTPVTMSNVVEVRAVGFGDTHVDGSGVRHEAIVSVESIDSNTLYLGMNDAGTATCFGDSGGPSMHVGPDLVERVVGVHSFSFSSTCTGGGDVRVDSIADFIDTWTREKAPTCATDGACVDGCPVQDLDCFCTADGTCSQACPLPDTDPDCPKNCLGDGVCAYGTCGKPDPDCLPDGEKCTSAEKCSGHQCLSDALHDEPYCSRTCKSSAECRADMRCAFGLCTFPVLPLAGMGDSCEVGRTLCSGGICGGQSVETATCRIGCGANEWCPGTMRCVGGILGVRYCQGTATLAKTSEQLPKAPTKCSASGGGAGALLALLLIRRRAARL